MPSIRAPIRSETGSFSPVYWTVANKDTGGPINLTAGYTAAMVVEDEHGTELLTVADLAPALRLTSEGRVYFEPLSTLSTTWPPMRASYQLELTPPAGPDYTVRIARGPFSNDYEMIKD